MDQAELTLAYRADDEWLGELIATVRAGEFSGKGSAWFDRTSVKKQFTTRLRSFPLDAADPPIIEGGFWSKEKSGSLDQRHLRISIKPFNSRGTLLVHVEVMSRSWESPDADLQNAATIRFLTEYAAVDIFAVHFEELLEGSRREAALKGTIM